MQKQTLLGRANRVRDKPEFYPVGSRHFVRLFSTYPSDQTILKRPFALKQRKKAEKEIPRKNRQLQRALR